LHVETQRAGKEKVTFQKKPFHLGICSYMLKWWCLFKKVSANEVST